MQSDSIDKGLIEYILPEGFIKDGFVTIDGSPSAYSYEDYLRELINQSTWFMKKTNGELFSKPCKESNAENDAETKIYSIDFKLVLGQSIQNVKSKTSLRIDQHNSGCVVYGVSSATVTKPAYWLHKVLRSLTKDNLREIIKGTSNSPEEKDVYAFSRSINKDKNLLLFDPIVFVFEGTDSADTGSVCEALKNDYGNALELRQEWFPERETYLAFVCNNALQIAFYNNSELDVVDSIDITKSDTFKWLCGFYKLDSTVNLLKI